jgi:hypothetical protein
MVQEPVEHILLNKYFGNLPHGAVKQGEILFLLLGTTRVFAITSLKKRALGKIRRD